MGDMGMSTVFERQRNLLNLAQYQEEVKPENCGRLDIECPFGRQYILRMMIKAPNEQFRIPPSLKWLTSTILRCDAYQKANEVDDTFVYITVRHGMVTSTTDDEWHVDGFSMRVTHKPEQNYVYANRYPLQYLSGGWDFPEDFDPLHHNLHWFFQDRSESRDILNAKAGHLYRFDPYLIHRRPPESQGLMRTFFRISFVPIEIEDDNATLNPILPFKFFGKKDFREGLTRYR